MTTVLRTRRRFPRLIALGPVVGAVLTACSQPAPGGPAKPAEPAKPSEPARPAEAAKPAEAANLPEVVVSTFMEQVQKQRPELLSDLKPVTCVQGCGGASSARVARWANGRTR